MGLFSPSYANCGRCRRRISYGCVVKWYCYRCEPEVEKERQESMKQISEFNKKCNGIPEEEKEA